MLAGPATAQQAAPNPNQVAAKALLQAADKAIGASSVKSFTNTATGWMGYPGQQFAQGDLPHSDLKTFTSHLTSPASPPNGTMCASRGTMGPRRRSRIPVQGEQKFTEFVSGNFAWNLNPQGQPVPINPGTPRIARSGFGSIRLPLFRGRWRTTTRHSLSAIMPGNRTVKVVAFTTKVCDRPQPQCTRR